VQVHYQQQQQQQRTMSESFLCDLRFDVRTIVADKDILHPSILYVTNAFQVLITVQSISHTIKFASQMVFREAAQNKISDV
jgi:hypothetical protein